MPGEQQLPSVEQTQFNTESMHRFKHPEGFEPPTTWSVATKTISIVLINAMADAPVANCTTAHNSTGLIPAELRHTMRAIPA